MSSPLFMRIQQEVLMKSTRTLLFMIAIVTLAALSMSSCKTASTAVENPAAVDDSTIESARPTNTPRPAPARPLATARPTQAPDTPTPPPTPTLAPTATPVQASADEEDETPMPEVSPTPTEQAGTTTIAPTFPKVPQIIATGALSLVPNVDPGPPLSVEISANHLLDGNMHRVSGTIHNDSDETYTGLGVIATFFMDNGKRYGPVDANVKCLLLAPGASCPFIVQATSKNLAEVILHVTGYTTPRTPLSPEFWGVHYSINSIGYVHVTGTVHNQYAIPARHLTVVGSLINAQGAIVNVNATILLDALPPGGTSSFDIHLKYAPFRTINITTQAEP